jgi:hypothetical protein
MAKQTRRGFLAAVVATAGATALPVAASAAPVDAMPEADLWAKGYLAGYGQGFDGAEGIAYTRGYHDGWDIGERMGRERSEQTNTEAAVVVGALYDFMGWLTTRDEPITVSRSHTVYAVMESFQAWAKERGFNIDAADVEGWQRRLA